MSVWDYFKVQVLRHVLVAKIPVEAAVGLAVTMTFTLALVKPLVFTVILPFLVALTLQDPPFFGVFLQETFGLGNEHAVVVDALSVRVRLPSVLGTGLCSFTLIGHSVAAVTELTTVTLAVWPFVVIEAFPSTGENVAGLKAQLEAEEHGDK